MTLFYAILCLFCGFEAMREVFRAQFLTRSEKDKYREREQGLQAENLPALGRISSTKKSRSSKDQCLDYDFAKLVLIQFIREWP